MNLEDLIHKNFKILNKMVYSIWFILKIDMMKYLDYLKNMA